MNKQNIGILHPGNMGISIAASAKSESRNIFWASKGRSQKTSDRAVSQNLLDAGSLKEICETCETLVSVCPPDAAEDLAKEVLALGFKGMYLDANAISPQRAKTIGKVMAEAGAQFVDGGIIGGPAWKPNSTWLYLSGKKANEMAACFDEGPLETIVIGDEIGKASALKMCFAAYTKGCTALLTGILGVSEKLGVREELHAQWSMGGSSQGDDRYRQVRGVTEKAWRFAGEMDEISATFESAGFPGGFHQSAAEVYRRIADFKDAKELPQIEEVLEQMLKE